MKHLFLILLCTGTVLLHAQELYVFSEPASNMPAKSLSVKLSATAGGRLTDLQQRYTPEIMLGINKNLMLHGALTFSNMHGKSLAWESVYSYGKYRFLSKDALHQHFRMALFAEGGYNRNPLMYDELNVQGNNSGIQAGVIATQLRHKLAVSATASMIRAFAPDAERHHLNIADKALNYSLSAGYLVLPKKYTSYDQLNLNVYAEMLAQQSLGGDAYWIDAAPAVQAIFNSNSKLNVGYRFQVRGNATRNMRNALYVSFEHTFFNALRRKKK